MCAERVLLGQTNAEALKAPPTTGLRSGPLQGLAHLKLERVTAPSEVLRKTHSLNLPNISGFIGSLAVVLWGGAQQRSPTRPAWEKTKQLPPGWHQACSL